MFLAFSASAQMSAGQSVFPPGGYRNFEDLRNHQPSVHAVFQAVARTTDDLKMMGGNDYYIKSESEGITKDLIQKDLYAVSTSDTLYLNTSVHMLPAGYSKSLTEGRFLAFRSGFRDKKKGRVMSAAMAMGLTGALIASLSKAKSGIERFLLAMDVSTGKLTLLDRNFLLSILKPYPDLEYQYALEQEQSNEKTLLKYVQMVDKKVSGN